MSLHGSHLVSPAIAYELVKLVTFGISVMMQTSPELNVIISLT